MATTKQVKAAKQNVKKAQAASKQKRSSASSGASTRRTGATTSGSTRRTSASSGASTRRTPTGTRRGTQSQATRATQRGGTSNRLEDRTRDELYEQAKKKNIAGRSKMGKSELIKALRGKR